jgi:hypothetical protein
MTAIDKAVSSDITLGQLLDGLAAAPEAPLVFLYEGQPVNPTSASSPSPQSNYGYPLSTSASENSGS